MKDKHGKPLVVGDSVRWQGRKMPITKFDKAFPSLVEVNDPGGLKPYSSTEGGGKRWLRADEVEKI